MTWILSNKLLAHTFDHCVNVKRCSLNTCPVLESVVFTLPPKWSRMTAMFHPSMSSSASAKANSLCQTFVAWRRLSWGSSVWSLKQSHHWPFYTSYTRPSLPGLLKGKIFEMLYLPLFSRSVLKHEPIVFPSWDVYWWIKWRFPLYFKGGAPKHWESGSPAKSVLMPACFL